MWRVVLCASKILAVYKSGPGTRGRGHRDACVGTWDLGTSSMGRRDVKNWDVGDPGC